MCWAQAQVCVWEWADRCGRVRDAWPEDFEKYKKERVEGQSNGKGQLPIAGEFFNNLVRIDFNQVVSGNNTTLKDLIPADDLKA